METKSGKFNMSPMLQAIMFNQTNAAVRYGGGKSPCRTAKSARTRRGSSRKSTTSSKFLLNFSTTHSTRALTSAGANSTMADNNFCYAFSNADSDNDEETKDYEMTSSAKETYKVMELRRPETRGKLVHSDSISEQ